MELYVQQRHRLLQRSGQLQLLSAARTKGRRGKWRSAALVQALVQVLVSCTLLGVARADEPCLAEQPCRADELSVVAGPNFTYVPGVNGLAQAACTSRTIARAALYDMAQRVRKQTGHDAQIAIVFAGDAIACDDLFYLPIANDTRGIGYQHQEPHELFDDSPDSQLEGIVFLGDVVYWERHAEEFQRAFNHELGHRWGARVHVVHDLLEPRALLGREEQHWSYFLDSEGSYLEGNRWLAQAGAQFVSATPLAGTRFSPLDLYLMGVLPAEEVPPFALLSPEALPTRDCKGHELSASSPPQWCEPMRVRGSTVRVSIDDVIAAEGPREPAAVAAREVSASVTVLSSGAAGFDAARCRTLSASLRERFDAFAEATGGRLRVRNVSEREGDCDAFEARAEAPAATATSQTGCQLSPRPASAYGAALWLVVLACARRRRRSKAGPRESGV